MEYFLFHKKGYIIIALNTPDSKMLYLADHRIFPVLNSIMLIVLQVMFVVMLIMLGVG